MDPQNQNTQPDYNFILNQPGEALPVGPKNSRKKPLILGVVIVILVMVIIGAVLLSGGAKSNTTNTPINGSAVGATTNPVNQFLDDLKTQDYNSAASLIPGGADNLDSSSQNLQTTFSTMDVNKCQVSAPQGDSLSNNSDLTCRRIDDSYGIKVHFRIVQDDSGPIILSYKVEVIK